MRNPIDINIRQISRILIRGTNWIGDAILTTPAIAAIRRGFPQAHITLCVIPAIAPVFQENPDIDDILLYDRNGLHAGLQGRYRMIQDLKRGRYDLAVLLQNAFEAAILAWGAGIPLRYGYNTDGRSYFLKPAVTLTPEILQKHQVDYYLNLLKPLLNDALQTTEDTGYYPKKLRLFLRKEEIRTVREQGLSLGLKDDGPWIGMHAGATYGTAKRWPPERFAALAKRMIHAYQAKIILFAGPGEEPVAHQIEKRVNHPDLFNLAGKTTLRHLMAWLGQLRLLVSNDSGPMHIATALGVPVVAMFGSTDPVTTGPFGRGHILVKKETSCAPCLLRECPTDHQCMEAILVEDVLRGVQRILGLLPPLPEGLLPPRLTGRMIPSFENPAERGAVFLDRDGTLNEEVGYVGSTDRLRLLPGVGDALHTIKELGLKTFIVTNQSGIARGYFTGQEVARIHGHLRSLLRSQGGDVDAIYVCPHHPNDGCRCRKPGTGMMIQAALEHGVDLSKSYMIGDKGIDIEMAHRSGAKGILVLTGFGTEELKKITTTPSLPSVPNPVHVAKNLGEAVRWIEGDMQRCVRSSQSQRRPLRRGDSLPDNPNILIIKPSSLGDIIHGLPVLKVLRDLWPQAGVSWVIKELWADILRGHPLIDELILLKRDSLTRGLIAFRKRLRQGHYDLAIDLQGLSRSGLIARLSGARIRLGFANARELAHVFYTHRVHVPREDHAVDRNLSLLKGLGWETTAKTSTSTSWAEFPLFVGEESSRRVEALLLEQQITGGRPLIVMLPGSRWEKKMWPVENFAALCTLLNDKEKTDIILLGSPQEETLIRTIQSQATGRTLGVTQLTLREMVSLLSRAAVLVTNDSGPMHVAAAVGTPVVALFGPTDPGRTGPFGQGHRVLASTLACRPCFRRPCIHDRYLCMESIPVAEVRKAVEDLLRF